VATRGLGLESLQASVAQAPGVDTMTPGIQWTAFPPAAKHCSDCGSAMQQQIGVFWFFEAEVFKWNLCAVLPDLRTTTHQALLADLPVY
jgi:hypothetical protein